MSFAAFWLVFGLLAVMGECIGHRLHRDPPSAQVLAERSVSSPCSQLRGNA
jgi:hypothetical protein